uniref:Uncharacterized protein n=1 Tax=Anguilla anguilla TaxID=7936 RepID=A0A0E9SXH3_ANGAN
MNRGPPRLMGPGLRLWEVLF